MFFISQDLLKLTLLKVPHPLKSLGARYMSVVFKNCLILANATSRPLFIPDGNLFSSTLGIKFLLSLIYRQKYLSFQNFLFFYLPENSFAECLY